MGGEGAKANLRIVYSNQKPFTPTLEVDLSVMMLYQPIMALITQYGCITNYELLFW